MGSEFWGICHTSFQAGWRWQGTKSEGISKLATVKWCCRNKAVGPVMCQTSPLTGVFGKSLPINGPVFGQVNRIGSSLRRNRVGLGTEVSYAAAGHCWSSHKIQMAVLASCLWTRTFKRVFKNIVCLPVKSIVCKSGETWLIFEYILDRLCCVL